LKPSTLLLRTAQDGTIHLNSDLELELISCRKHLDTILMREGQFTDPDNATPGDQKIQSLKDAKIL